MTNKKTNLKVIATDEVKPKGRLSNSPSRSGAVKSSVSQDKTQIVERQMVLDNMAKQVFSSEQQALETLLSNIASRFSDDPRERADMADFLEMILETDPGLRQDILSGTTIRKL